MNDCGGFLVPPAWRKELLKQARRLCHCSLDVWIVREMLWRMLLVRNWLWKLWWRIKPRKVELIFYKENVGSYIELAQFMELMKEELLKSTMIPTVYFKEGDCDGEVV